MDGFLNFTFAYILLVFDWRVGDAVLVTTNAEKAFNYNFAASSSNDAGSGWCWEWGKSKN